MKKKIANLFVGPKTWFRPTEAIAGAWRSSGMPPYSKYLLPLFKWCVAQLCATFGPSVIVRALL